MARARKRHKPERAPGILDAQDDNARGKEEGTVVKTEVETESTKTIKTKKKQQQRQPEMGNEEGVKEVDEKGKEDEDKSIVEKLSVKDEGTEEVAEFRESVKERLRLRAGGKRVNYCLDYQWFDEDEEGFSKKKRRKGNKQKKKVAKTRVEDEEQQKGDDRGKKEDIDDDEEEEEEKVVKSKRKGGSNRREPKSEENGEKKVKEGDRRDPSGRSKIYRSEESGEKEVVDGKRRNPSRGSNVPKRFDEFVSDNTTKKKRLPEVRKAFLFFAL